MKNAFQFGKTNVSMREHDFGHGVVAWQVIYTKNGVDSVHLQFDTETECDAAMDTVQAEAIAWNKRTN